MPITTAPELVRSDISLYLLQLKALGIDNLVRFDFLSPPPTEMMIRALEFLYSLKALDEEGRLTRPLGINMAEVPVNPMMAAIVSGAEISRRCRALIIVFQLLNSQDFQCGEEILTIAAMTSVQVCLQDFRLSH
jgi:ATP-dependent RNA helicase DDX35